jgi:hypothetical protein
VIDLVRAGYDLARVQNVKGRITQGVQTARLAAALESALQAKNKTLVGTLALELQRLLDKE